MTDNPILWVLLAIGAILLFVLLLAGITSLLTAFFGKRYALRLDRTYCGRMSALLPGEDCGEFARTRAMFSAMLISNLRPFRYIAPLPKR